MKYNYQVEDNKVIAYCNYAGKRIQASATCCPEDVFNLDTGKALAARRLDIKIAEKRYKRAAKRMEQAQIHAMIAAAEVEDKVNYFHNVENALYTLEEEYDDLIENLS